MKEIAGKKKKNTFNEIIFVEKKKNITLKKVIMFYYNK